GRATPSVCRSAGRSRALPPRRSSAPSGSPEDSWCSAEPARTRTARGGRDRCAPHGQVAPAEGLQASVAWMGANERPLRYDPRPREKNRGRRAPRRICARELLVLLQALVNVASTVVRQGSSSCCLGHHDLNGGSNYKPRSVALKTTETCLICHGPGRAR